MSHSLVVNLLLKNVWRDGGEAAVILTANYLRVRSLLKKRQKRLPEFTRSSNVGSRDREHRCCVSRISQQGRRLAADTNLSARDRVNVGPDNFSDGVSDVTSDRAKRWYDCVATGSANGVLPSRLWNRRSR